MTRLALLLAFALVPIGLIATVGASAPERSTHLHGTVWAVERFDGGVNTLSAYDAATGEVLGTMPVGRRPIGVVVPRGTGKVYTADERSNQLTVVTKRSFAAGAPDVHRIPTGAFPHHLMASTNGRRLYVGEYGTNKVGVVDTRLDVARRGMGGQRATPRRRRTPSGSRRAARLYATNEGTTQAAVGTLSKLDARPATCSGRSRSASGRARCS